MSQTHNSSQPQVLSDEQFPELCQFLSDFYDQKESVSHWESTFDAWWKKNPCYTTDFERGWVSQENQSTIGFFGSFPSRMKVGDQQVTGYNSTTWRVLESHRTKSMPLLHRYLIASRDGIAFDTTPSTTVIKLLEAMRFEKITFGDYRYLLPLNPALMAKKAISSPVLSTIVTSALKPLLSIWQIGLKTLLFRPSSTYEIKELQDTDDRFDVLWNETKDHYDCTNVRTADIVRWQALSTSSKPKRIIGCYQNNKLVAYALFLEQDYLLTCLDLWGKNINAQLIHAIASFLVKTTCPKTYMAINFPAFHKDHDKEFGTIKGLVKLAHTHAMYYLANPEITTQLKEGSSYFCYLQGDFGM